MITHIIPIHNCLQSRDLDRLRWQILSLQMQQEFVPDIAVVTSSDEYEVQKIKTIVGEFENYPAKLEILIQKRNHLNFGKLINAGARLYNNPIVQVSGIDFIYAPNFTNTTIEKVNDTRTALVCLVRMMHKAEYDLLTIEKLKSFDFDHLKFNNAGKLANGIATFHRDLWQQIGGVNERMVGMSGMDNDLINRAVNSEARIVYTESETTCVHLSHPSVKSDVATGEQRTNWRIRNQNQRRKVINWRDGAK